MDKDKNKNPRVSFIEPEFLGFAPSQSLQRSPTRNEPSTSTSPGTSRSVSPHTGVCNKCSTRLDPLEKNNTICYTCYKRFHVHCVTGDGLDEKFFANISRKISHVNWNCTNCKIRHNTKGDKVVFLNDIKDSEIIKDAIEEKTQALIQENEYLKTELHQTKAANTTLDIQVKNLSNIINTPANVTEQESKILQLGLENNTLKNEIATLKPRVMLVNKLTTQLADAEQTILDLRKKLDSTNKRNRTDMHEENIEMIGDRITNQIVSLLIPRIEKLENDIKLSIDTNSTKNNVNVNKPNSRSNSSSRNKITYAEALTHQQSDPSLFKNIIINSQDPESFKKELKNSHSFDEIKITSVKNKSPNMITVKCADPIEANKLEDKMKIKYPNDITVSNIETKQPQLKITNINTELEGQELLLHIEKQNYWIPSGKLTIIRKYEITTPNRKYNNIIVSCDIEVFKKILDIGFILFGFNQCRVFEHINYLQCHNCWKYGHTQFNCKHKKVCKICGKEHDHTTCTEERHTCNNCNNYNLQHGTSININHKITDDRCHIRKERLTGLLDFLEEKATTQKHQH